MTSRSNRKERRPSGDGFTLVEAILSMTILGLVAAALFGVYASGMQAMEETIFRSEIEAAARGRMEKLLAYKYNRLSGGEETVTIDGTAYTVRWWSTPIDLSGDSVPDSGVKAVYVQCEDVILATIVFDGIDHRIKI